MQTVCAPFVLQATATHGKNLPAVVFQTAAERYSGQRFPSVVANLRTAAQSFGEISFNLCDIVVTALHQTIQIEPSASTSLRLSTECLLVMIANTRSFAGRRRKRP